MTTKRVTRIKNEIPSQGLSGTIEGFDDSLRLTVFLVAMIFHIDIDHVAQIQQFLWNLSNEINQNTR